MTDCYKSASTTAEENKRRRNEFLTQVLGGQPAQGETWVKAMAKKYAAGHFPDCTDSFIDVNALALSEQLMQDYICDTCQGARLDECPTGGHRSFLQVDKYSGVCTQVVEYENCGKVLISLPITDGQPMKRQTAGTRFNNRGFTSAGEVAAGQYAGE